MMYNLRVLTSTILLVILLWANVLTSCKADTGAKSEKAKPSPDVCDLHLWYMDRVADGVLDGDLSVVQQKVKKRVESLIADKGHIACSTLNTFEKILQPKIGASEHKKVDEGVRSSGNQDLKKILESLSVQKSTEDKSGAASEKSEKTSKESERTSKESERGESERDSKTKDAVYDGREESIGKKSEDKPSPENFEKSYIISKNNRKQKAKRRVNGFTPTCRRSERKCYLSEHLFPPLPTLTKNSHTLPPLRLQTHCVSPAKFSRGKKRFREDSFTSSVYCYYFHGIKLEKRTSCKTKVKRKALSKVIQESCQLSNKCSLRCFYISHRQWCVPYYDTHSNQSRQGRLKKGTESENTESDVEDIETKSDDTKSKSNRATSDDTESKNEERQHDIRDTEGSGTHLDEMDSKSSRTESADTELDEKEGEKENTRATLREKPSDSASRSEITKDKEVKSDDSDDEKFRHDGNSVDVTQTEETLIEHTEEHSTEDKKEASRNLRNTRVFATKTEKRNKPPKNSEGHSKDAGKQPRKRSNPDKSTKNGLAEEYLRRIEAKLQQKASEQAAKVQSLEVLVMKLENQILAQKLNEQNESTYIVHLENQILRIQHELLRLNQSYSSLHDENELLKSRQSKYLALEHKSSQKEKNQAALPSNSSKYFELVTVQQRKLSFLNELLNNQSSALHKLQSHSDKLEEQNQLLYQIMMNQTAFISHIMHKLQEVSEENLKNRQETNELKSKIDLQSSSSNIIHKLENMLDEASPKDRNPSDKGNVATTVDDSSARKSPSEHIQEDVLSVLKSLSLKPEAPIWDCGSSERRRLCIHFTVLLSACPPFRPISWSKCPHVLGEVEFSPTPDLQKRDQQDHLENQDSIGSNNISPSKEEPRLQRADDEDLPDSVNIPTGMSGTGAEDTKPDEKASESIPAKPVPTKTLPTAVEVNDGQNAEIGTETPDSEDDSAEKQKTFETLPDVVDAHDGNTEREENFLQKGNTGEREKETEEEKRIKEEAEKARKVLEEEQKMKEEIAKARKILEKEKRKDDEEEKAKEKAEEDKKKGEETELVRKVLQEEKKKEEEAELVRMVLHEEKRMKEEAELVRKVLHEEKRMKEEAEIVRKVLEEEKRKEEEEEKARKALEEEKMKTEEEEKAKKAEEEKRKTEEEEEKARKAEEKKRKTEEEEKAFLAEEEKRKTEEEEKSRKALEEEEKRKTEEEEKAKKAEEEKRKTEEEEKARKVLEEEEKRKSEEEEKARKAEEEKRKTEEEEKARKAEEEKRKTEEEEKANKAEQEKRKTEEEEKARKALEEKRKTKEAEKARKLDQQKNEAEVMAKKMQEAETRTTLYRSPDARKPKDCYDLYKRGSTRNGAYKVYVRGLNLYVSAYCDMKDGGWTVLMRREDGSVDFYKDWRQYVDGFGASFSEHYLGNEVIHYLTNQDHYSLKVDLKDWTGKTRVASYQHFWIEDEEQKFKLHVLGYNGTAGDGLGKHDEMKFSTKDQDNDLLKAGQLGGSCATRFHGAGWYYKCYMSNLMGMHYVNGVVPEKQFDGVAWKPWTGPSYSLKEVVLKVRPRGAG